MTSTVEKEIDWICVDPNFPHANAVSRRRINTKHLLRILPLRWSQKVSQSNPAKRTKETYLFLVLTNLSLLRLFIGIYTYTSLSR